MRIVITYGTFDLLHYGHIRLLERAKALGDYLIVGVTSDSFDTDRGKLSVQQSLAERMQGVIDTGIADKVIAEEYEGQKIDDIKRYDADIFAIGSDWKGHFDYLREYCRVVYLERTEGVSSSEIRAREHNINIGILGYSSMVLKFIAECNYINGVNASGMFVGKRFHRAQIEKLGLTIYPSYEEMLDNVDAVYVVSNPDTRYKHVKEALERGKSVLCESPIAISADQAKELFVLAKKKGCILYEGIKTAYATAFSRLVALAKSGVVGDIKCVEATCTSLKAEEDIIDGMWGCLDEWGPIAVLPVFELLGTQYDSKEILTFKRDDVGIDVFTKINFRYPQALASIKVGIGVKSEGELIISGTKGYIYVPAPWWKTEYFETRFEKAELNRRYFYPLEGEGIRYEISAFMRAMHDLPNFYIDRNVSVAISTLMEDFHSGKDVILM